MSKYACASEDRITICRMYQRSRLNPDRDITMTYSATQTIRVPRASAYVAGRAGRPRGRNVVDEL